MRQLALPLPLAPAFDEEDFLISSSNQRAFEQIAGWRDWPGRSLVLIGPEASGKSHLAAILAARTGGRVLAASGLRVSDIPDFLDAPVLVLEGADKGGYADEALFHLINLGLEKKVTLLLTARKEVGQWPISIPDLASRLRRMPVVALEPPDDSLMRALLIKQFSDRQIGIDEALIAYLMVRIERSYGAIQAMVARLDAEALARGRKVNRAFAQDLLSHNPP